MPATKAERETTTNEMGDALSDLVRAAQAVRLAARARGIKALKTGLKTAEKVMDAAADL